jgi:hypothetical protein
MSFARGIKNLAQGRFIRAAREFSGEADRRREREQLVREQERLQREERAARERELRAQERAAAAAQEREEALSSVSAERPRIPHVTWRDITSQADHNIRDGEWYSSYGPEDNRSRSNRYRYNLIERDLEGLRQYAELELELSADDANRWAYAEKLELLKWQARAFDAYARNFDPGPGRALRARVLELGLHDDSGNYHGNTATSLYHYHGPQTAAMKAKAAQTRRARRSA